MYEIYTISDFDTLDSIATKYGIEKELIYQLNGLAPDYIPESNDQLVLPSMKNQTFKYYTVKKGDNIYQIANDNNIDYNMLLKINGLNKEDYIYPNQTLLLPKNSESIYLTKEGDTINEILENLNIDINTLLDENNNIFLQPEQIIVKNNNNKDLNYQQFL